MRRIRLMVLPPSDEQFRDATASLGTTDLNGHEAALRLQMTITFKQQVKNVMRTPLEGSRAGVGIEEMEKSLAVLQKVDKAEDGGVLELEEEEHAYLLQKMAVTRWGAHDDRLVLFAYTVRNATSELLE